MTGPHSTPAGRADDTRLRSAGRSVTDERDASAGDRVCADADPMALVPRGEWLKVELLNAPQFGSVGDLLSDAADDHAPSPCSAKA